MHNHVLSIVTQTYSVVIETPLCLIDSLVRILLRAAVLLYH